MDFINQNILSLILFSPLLAALVVLLLPGQNKDLARRVAFALSLVPLAFTLIAWFGFGAAPEVDGFRMQEQHVWFPAINASYHLGIDGLSLSMVLLTVILTPLAILASFSVDDKVKAYMALFLALETGMLGVFLSLDLLLFFVFWEIGLVPMYFLIDQWGSKGGERQLWNGIKMPSRRYAAFKFMVYTMAGSLGLLAAIQMLGVVSGSFDLLALYQSWPALTGTLFGYEIGTVKAVAFWAFAVAFAIKVPIWPFHTWLPDAHTEAPTAGSMILAGVLLKLGAYGFLRLVLPLYPEQAQQYAPVLAALATAAIIFGAFSAFAQTDFKRLVAYSSVNHMGFVVLGIAAAAFAAGTESANIAVNGAVLQMFNHGISAAAMFFMVGIIYERTHTRNLEEWGGLFAIVPVFGALLILSSMASLGLPGLNGFVSEFLVVRGAWPIFTFYTALSMLGLLFTGAYILKGIAKSLHGPLNEKWRVAEGHAGHFEDVTRRELLVLSPLVVLMLWLGIWPAWLLDVINQAMLKIFG
ncbi:MAG: NADH-quinone oxidoreductase subunit M [Anaerolineales bacterium]|nr:NADH-quinone oxidoreductase subunit M [Anaerolineales bacterium]MCW5855187.1 NADH-quinone oxidoreductase subunit M [Anaerolineales bacterium]